MTDRNFLWLAEVFFAVSVLLTGQRWRAGEAGGTLHRANYLAMLTGFILQTAFLYLRGLAVGRCPLTTMFEMTIFIAWAMVLFYLLIGPSYRVSFLGAFTAPVVLALVAVVLLGMNDAPRALPLNRSPWVDFHAAIGVVACGALALAAVVAGMYLRQEGQLKSRRPGRALLLLPAVEQLAVINYRLLVLGFVMLTVGMAGGVVAGPWTPAKTAWAVAAWAGYGALVAGRLTGRLHAYRLARWTIGLFGLVLIGFWLVYLLPS